jgi:hypothetical protein
MITVNWSPRSLVDKTQPTKATTILDFEPVKITSLIGKDSVYAKCPAFIDYTKNTFALLAPFDIDIKISHKDGQCFVDIGGFNSMFFDDFFVVRQDGTFSFAPSLVFTSKETVIVESLPLLMINTELSKKVTHVVGSFDISKWVRPVEWAFILNEDTTLSIKRGDPIFCVRFATPNNEIVKLERFYPDQLFENIHAACVQAKLLQKGMSLKKMYEMAEPILKLWRKK